MKICKFNKSFKDHVIKSLTMASYYSYSTIALPVLYLLMPSHTYSPWSLT